MPGEIWAISVITSVVPTVLYVLILWWFDRYEKEPRHLLLAAFIWGAVPAAILSIIGEAVLGQPLVALGEAPAQLLSSSLLAPVVEESAKGFAVFLLLLFFWREFDDVLDGIIYGATVGFGFATSENVFYFADSLQQAGLEGLATSAFFRAIIFGMNHALFTSLFGASLGYARMGAQGCLRWAMPLLGLLGAMFVHGMHNLLVSLSSAVCLLMSVMNNWGGMLVILAVILLAAQQEKRWIAAHLKAEVESGLLTAEEYDMIGSYRKRLGAIWRARSRYGPGEARRLSKLAQLATELAFKIEQGDERTAQKLRGEIAALRGTQAIAK
ncbi:MAG: PrsW family intramembrane metalloprotease [Chloroflexi bacterium]|nr:PrsW family intramembrane metalloprotease [Chloroflexota bacterium]